MEENKSYANSEKMNAIEAEEIAFASEIAVCRLNK